MNATTPPLCEHDPYPGAGYHCLRDRGHLGLCSDLTITWTSPALAEQDARDYPHDEPCPRCGRRQWGLAAADPANPTDAEQETCAGCGATFTETQEEPTR